MDCSTSAYYDTQYSDANDLREIPQIFTEYSFGKYIYSLNSLRELDHAFPTSLSCPARRKYVDLIAESEDLRINDFPDQPYELLFRELCYNEMARPAREKVMSRCVLLSDTTKFTVTIECLMAWTGA